VRGHVAAAVEHRVHLSAVAVAGERRPAVTARPVAEPVAVVDGDRHPPLHLGDGAGPGAVAGQADLDAAALRPPAGGPREQLLRGRAAQALGPVRGHLDQAAVEQHVQRHRVQPLVGDQQAGQLGHPRRPPQGGARVGGELDAGEAPAGGHVGQRLQQLPAGGADVDEVEGVGRPRASSTRPASSRTAAAKTGVAPTDVRKCRPGDSRR
jgi:hypothetical protein